MTSAAADPFRTVDLIAIDLDGTLLNRRGGLVEANRQAVAEARRTGVEVVIATARPPRSTAPILQQLACDGLHADELTIHYNGALIRQQPGCLDLLHQPLGPKLAKSIITHTRRQLPDVVVSLEVMDRWYTDRHDPALGTQTSLLFEPDDVGPLDHFAHLAPTKLMLAAPPSQIGPLLQSVRDKFSHDAKILQSDPHLIQIAAPEVDKAAAVQWIARQRGIPISRVMAVGDAANDLDMIRTAGVGVAVANAAPQVIAAADCVAPTNDESGVAWAIRAALAGDLVQTSPAP